MARKYTLFPLFAFKYLQLLLRRRGRRRRGSRRGRRGRGKRGRGRKRRGGGGRIRR
jgi:hypothetical protein